ncbi:MAG: zinc ribbon domain-containing protein [Oscillospiraceae bacterium]|nr:zinc ribbon domain-containing protein [Oscillospiraceae bacterium]MBQ8881050.1 zinc ribbon domain-containing protein [Oscillospiraceae bacterium]
MFCPKCGKEIADTAAFCPGCGNPVNGQAAPASAPVATAVAKPSAFMQLLNSFLAILKGLFTPNVVKVVGEQAKNTGLEWVFGIALSVLSFAFALPVNMLEGLRQLIADAVGAKYASEAMKHIDFPFFGMFGSSLLVAILTLGALVAGLWLLTKLVAKKQVPWTCVLNMVATATLPLSLCYIANMLLGLIWVPLCIVVSVVALFMTMILLYAGFQKLEKPESSPFYPYTALVAVVVIVALLMSYLLYKGALGDLSINSFL